MREALLGGFAQSRVLEVHGERALKGTYKPGFKTHLYAKDMRNVVATLAEQNDLFIEAGLYIKPLRILPFVKYESQNFDLATAVLAFDHAAINAVSIAQRASIGAPVETDPAVPVAMVNAGNDREGNALFKAIT